MKKKAYRVAMIFLVVLAILIAFIFGIGYFLSAPKYTGPVTDHFNGQNFINPEGIQASGFGDLLRWMMKRERGPWSYDTAAKSGPKPEVRVSAGLQITFVNHSTFLIQTRGLNILTDPIWSERTSPFQWAGPRRMRVPGIRFEDLPKIDFVVISHNHYDHLDINTLEQLYKRDRPTFIVPLGISAFLRQHDIEPTIELDWWQTTMQSGLEITAVPAQHFSGRGMFDRDATLWCGYIMKLDSGYLYFAGDTGYNSKTFKEISNRFSPIEVALIPIGAYKPRWFMSPIHCSPAEAVQIHIDVRARRSLAMHFGTFPLADDGRMDPIHDLKRALREKQIDLDAFIVPEEGKAFRFSE